MREIRELTAAELEPELLAGFSHRQRITRTWVRRGGEWELAETDLLREWGEKKQRWVPEYLKQQVERGGAAFAAYDGERIAGFVCLDGILAGKGAKYANLTMLFVDDRLQGKGIGRQLFDAACARAKRMGADRLFISAVPSQETVAFYFRRGCTDAEEIIPEFVDTEEDRYLERRL